MSDGADKPFRLIGLPGDGIGPEVYAAAKQALEVLAGVHGFNYQLTEHLIGGAAFDETGDPLPDATLEGCRSADGILLGAVGGPKWDDNTPDTRPEKGLLRLRGSLGLFCNLRPIATHPSLSAHSPVRSELLAGVDIMIVRELTGGIYFGDKLRERDTATDICRYSVAEIERVARKAGAIAQGRRGKVTMVDKANVLETSRLWREVTARVFQSEFSELHYETLLVDAAAMHLLSRPGDFDVMLTENLFGDILSDEASMLCGSLGILPSASLREDRLGVYEPCHGSAPDIAGRGIANPYGMLSSLALLLRHSLELEDAAAHLERTIAACWDAGVFTPDLDDPGVDTATATHAVCERLAQR